MQATAPLVEDGRVVGLETDVGPIRARAVVAADGLRSRLRSQLDLELPTPRARARMGLRLHLRVPSLPFGASVRVIVDRDLEWYVTPVAPDLLQVALLGSKKTFARRKLSAATLWPALLQHGELGLLLAGAEPVDRALGAGPFLQRVRSVATGGAILVGDAAGYVDAITGEGMGQALRQGIAAGETLAAAMAAARGREPLPLFGARALRARPRGDRARRWSRSPRWCCSWRGTRGWRAVPSPRWRAARRCTSLLRVQAGAPLSSLRFSDWARLVTG